MDFSKSSPLLYRCRLTVPISQSSNHRVAFVYIHLYVAGITSSFFVLFFDLPLVNYVFQQTNSLQLREKKKTGKDQNGDRRHDCTEEIIKSVVCNVLVSISIQVHLCIIQVSVR